MHHAIVLLIVASLDHTSCLTVGTMKKTYPTTRAVRIRCERRTKISKFKTLTAPNINSAHHTPLYEVNLIFLNTELVNAQV